VVRCVHVCFLVFNLLPILCLQKDMMSEFYKTISLGKSILCAGVDGMRMQIAWRDHKNKIDCGGWRRISAKG